MAVSLAAFSAWFPCSTSAKPLEFVKQVACSAPPGISNFRLTNNDLYGVGLPWVQQFSVDYQPNGGAGFASIYDDSGATSLVFSGFKSGTIVGNRGVNWWQPGSRVEHAMVKTDCGAAQADLKFSFQLQGFDTAYSRGVLVATGDSYSSGEGNPPFISDSACHVSPVAWPSLMFDGLDGTAPYFETNLACSGARIADLFQPFKGQPSQLEQLKKLKPDTAVITIGGNDLGFGKMLFQCFSWNCQSNSQFRESKQDILNLEPRLKSAFDRLRKVVPRLVVVGYPQIFPSTQAETTRCGWLTPVERDRLNVLTVRLDEAEKQAALGAKAEYVSILGVLHGHELCSKDSWMFKITPSCKFDSLCAHPILNGQWVISNIVEGYIG